MDKTNPHTLGRAAYFGMSVGNEIEKERKRGSSTGILLIHYCDICGLPRAHYNHEACSKKRQKLHAKDNAAA